MILAKHWYCGTGVPTPGIWILLTLPPEGQAITGESLYYTLKEDSRSLFLYINVQSYCSNCTSTDELFVCCTVFLDCFYIEMMMHLSSAFTSKPMCPLPLQHYSVCYTKWVQEGYRLVKWASFSTQHLCRSPCIAILHVINESSHLPAFLHHSLMLYCSSLTPPALSYTWWPYGRALLLLVEITAAPLQINLVQWSQPVVLYWILKDLFILNIPTESDKTHSAHFSIKCITFLEQSVQNSHNHLS